MAWHVLAFVVGCANENVNVSFSVGRPSLNFNPICEFSFANGGFYVKRFDVFML